MVRDNVPKKQKLKTLQYMQAYKRKLYMEIASIFTPHILKYRKPQSIYLEIMTSIYSTETQTNDILKSRKIPLGSQAKQNKQVAKIETSAANNSTAALRGRRLLVAGC